MRLMSVLLVLIFGAAPSAWAEKVVSKGLSRQRSLATKTGMRLVPTRLSVRSNGDLLLRSVVLNRGRPVVARRIEQRTDGTKIVAERLQLVINGQDYAARLTTVSKPGAETQHALFVRGVDTVRWSSKESVKPLTKAGAMAEVLLRNRVSYSAMGVAFGVGSASLFLGPAVALAPKAVATFGGLGSLMGAMPDNKLRVQAAAELLPLKPLVELMGNRQLQGAM